MRLTRSTAMLVVLLVISAPTIEAAWADNPSSPMKFSYSIFPRPSHIFLDGIITNDTPQQFAEFYRQHLPPHCTEAEKQTDYFARCRKPKVFFMSPGGSLGGGMALGKIMRHLQVKAAVGAKDPISTETQNMLLNEYHIPYNPNAPLDRYNFATLDAFPGYCISACTLAFLGAVDRGLIERSIFAVHQFSIACKSGNHILLSPACAGPDSASSAAQQIAAEILQYLDEMGIPVSFYYDMVKANPDNLNALSPAQLLKYNIYTVPH